MRGLKYQDIPFGRIPGMVALYTSAWIEIIPPIINAFDSKVALYTSAWIEIIISL